MSVEEEFGENADQFIRQVGSLRRMVPLYAHVSATITRRTNKDIDEFVEKHAEDVEKDEEGVTKRFSVPNRV